MGKSDIKQKTFEEMLLAHVDVLYNIAWRMTHNREDAQDLVQEASLRGYRFFDKFKEGTNFKAWLITVMRNIFINNYRKRKKEPAQVDFAKVENFISADKVTGLEEELVAENLGRAIADLPEELRTTLTLFYLEGFSYKEIAAIMDIPLGTVMSRLHTARQALKQKMFVYSKEETY